MLSRLNPDDLGAFPPLTASGAALPSISSALKDCSDSRVGDSLKSTSPPGNRRAYSEALRVNLSPGSTNPAPHRTSLVSPAARHDKQSCTNLDFSIQRTRLGGFYQTMWGKCFRCGEAGHLAKECRNARICFKCGCTGHISSSCKPSFSSNSSTNSGDSISRVPPPIPQISSLHPRVSFPNPRVSSSNPPPMENPSSYVIPIYEDDSVGAVESELSCSVVILTNAEVSFATVMAGVKHYFEASRTPYTVRNLGSYRFVIEGSEIWKKEVELRKAVRVGTTDYPILDMD